MRAENIFSLARWLALIFTGGMAIAGLVMAALPALGWFPAVGAHGFGLESFHALMDFPGITRSLFLSLWTGLAASLLSLVLAFAILAHAHGTAAFNLLRHAVSPLLSVPHAATAIGLALVIAPSGMLFRLAGFDRPPDVFIPNDPYALSLIAGLVVKEVPFLFLVSLAALTQIPVNEQMRAARALGYREAGAFVKVILPQLYRRIRLPVLAVVSYSAAPAEMALILGPQEPPLLIVTIMKLISNPDLELRLVASAGAVVQAVIVGLSLLVWWMGEKLLGAIMLRVARNGARRQFTMVIPVLSIISMFSAGIILALAAVSLVFWSLAESWRFPELMPSGFTLAHWGKAIAASGPALLTTAALAVVSAFISVCLAAMSLEGGRQTSLESLAIFAPLILPQIAILAGLQWLLVPFGAQVFVITVGIAHVIFVYPYVMLSLAGPWRAFDTRYVMTARSLGAGPWKVFFRVRLPLLAPALFTAFAVGFAVSSGLYLPTLMAGGGRVVTITTEAVALSSGGDRRMLAIYAMAQALLPFAGFWVAMMCNRSR